MQEGIYSYLPQIMAMAPSIAITLIYLSLTLCISVFVDWDVRSGLVRMLLMMGLTAVIFGISITIGIVLKQELPESLINSTFYNMNIHEEFLIALCVEMAGAIIFVPFIYGSDDRPQFLVLSMIFSLIFLYLLFIFPVGDFVKGSFEIRRSIIDNYVENFRVELLSLIFLFFFYSLVRIFNVEGVLSKMLRFSQLIIMTVIVSAFVWWHREIMLEPEYENLYLAIGAGFLSIIILGIAKINEKLLWIIIVLTGIASLILLVGTQIPDFQFDPPTAINLVAELIGAIAVALVLDTDMEM